MHKIDRIDCNAVHQRLTYQAWKELEPYWLDGLVERISIVTRPFASPILVHPSFLPLPDPLLSLDIQLHGINSLETLNIPTNMHDLILLSPFLQWTHDVPGVLAQAHHALAEGGFFVGCFFGQDTLVEFKSVCATLDFEQNQGLQQRFLPTIHTKDAGMLMQRAGFASPTADIEHLNFSVPSVAVLVEKLRNSGVNHIFTKRDKIAMLPRSFCAKANDLYQTNYPHSAGGLDVTIELIYICGWKQAKSPCSVT